MKKPTDGWNDIFPSIQSGRLFCQRSIAACAGWGEETGIFFPSVSPFILVASLGRSPLPPGPLSPHSSHPAPLHYILSPFRNYLYTYSTLSFVVTSTLRYCIAFLLSINHEKVKYQKVFLSFLCWHLSPFLGNLFVSCFLIFFFSFLF